MRDVWRASDGEIVWLFWHTFALSLSERSAENRRRVVDAAVHAVYWLDVLYSTVGNSNEELLKPSRCRNYVEFLLFVYRFRDEFVVSRIFQCLC